VVKVHTLLARQGVGVPRRTLERFCAELCGPRRGQKKTVRVADGEPGVELQVDFGRMGLMFDPETDRRRVVHALIFTPCLSGYSFVWLTFSQTLADILCGFEAVWEFFGGIFAVVIPDNMAAIVDKANPTEPRLNAAFVEYAQDRGFLVDATRVRHPKDKPRVERTVPYVRGSFFAGEHFVDLPDAQRRAVQWCTTTAGLRVHGTTACRPAEHFALLEAPALLPLPVAPYDLPHYATPKVGSRPPCRGGQGPVLGAGQPDRPAPRRPGRQGLGQALFPRSTGQGPPPPSTRRSFDRPGRPAQGHRGSTRCVTSSG